MLELVDEMPNGIPVARLRYINVVCCVGRVEIQSEI